ncbi:T9SS type A sorting domain-containing protein [Mariniphaga sediminis]|uniref:T9SS type A sorting domain-containing protein n=1 Tax=Mariniphaga sediminis TaxID=1628158 RepID=UPI0035655A26
MKKITILSVFMASAMCGFSQSAAKRLIEYRPAPGQHMNMENIGTPQAAQKMTGDTTKMVSLGSFGGYVVLGFEKACVNHPDNPYGIDFTVFGNAIAGSSEPGVIWVMADENQNGQPDETWYEIAGSHHAHPKTKKNYAVTYFKTDTRDIFWKDNLGETGWIRANSFNLQEYYPLEENFPGYPQESVTFEGTMFPTEIDSSNLNSLKILPPVFGYADAYPRKQNVDVTLPDNPYTIETEGAGGDPVDISWAIDLQGNYVDLDSIHFVKIVSGNLASIGWLGEVSTDVAWVQAVKPRPEISGKENRLVVYRHPLKMLKGDSLQLEARYFEKGRNINAPVSVVSQNENVIRLSSTGKLLAHASGEAVIKISAGEEVEYTTLKVVIPDSIRLLSDFSSVYPGDSIDLDVQVFDNEQEKISVPVQFLSSNTLVGKVIEKEGTFIFVAVQPGETVFTCSAEGFPLEKQVRVNVYSADDKIRVYFTLMTEDENLLPFQWIEVEAGNLNEAVENRQSDYSGLNQPTLFHALASGLEKAEAAFRFKDDDAASGKLYLYSVEKDGLFTYGWGGKTEPAAFARAWIARWNSKQFLNTFDQKEIADGDTVALYHVPGISEDWNYTRLLSSKDSALTGEEVEITLEETSCSLANDVISESGFIPVSNAEVTAGSTYFTDETGKVAFTLENEPPLIVSSGSNAVLISKKLTTGVVPIARKVFRAYPNPVEDNLFIQGGKGVELTGNRGTSARILDPTGRVLFEKELVSGLVKMDLSSLPSGMYYLVIIQKGEAETHKIIKK